MIPTAPFVSKFLFDGSNREHAFTRSRLKLQSPLPSGLLSDESPWFSATDVDVGAAMATFERRLGVGVMRLLEPW
ncbi:hypothetical protein O9992_27610 [Vibrio lentus]|nr:hypothetical protein [Vibrio lentus]